MKTNIRPDRRRANSLVAIMVLVIGAVVIIQLYRTAKKLLPNPPAPPVGVFPTNGVPTNLPDITEGSLEWFTVPDQNVSNNPSYAYLVYGLMCTNEIDGTWYGAPGPVVPVFQLANADGSGTGWNTLSNYMQDAWGINVDSYAQLSEWSWGTNYYTGQIEGWFTKGGGYVGSANDGNIITAAMLEGWDEIPVWTNDPEVYGGMAWVWIWPPGEPPNGMYWVTLDHSTDCSNWTNVQPGYWLHSGQFVVYQDANAAPGAGFYRVTAFTNQPQPFPAVVSTPIK